MPNRRLTGSTQLAIAAAAAGLGALVTLIITNAINHAGWSAWAVILGWIALIALATLSIKVRHASMRGVDSGGRLAGTAPGDGMHSDGGG